MASQKIKCARACTQYRRSSPPYGPCGASGLVCTIAAVLLLAGCQLPVSKPDYDRPLPPGTFGLRKIINPAQLPDLSPLISQLHDPSFREAQQHSLRWFGIKSTQQFFPIGPIHHEHAHASVYALGQIQSLDELLTEFDVWESVGWNGSGEVLYTGYYSPRFRGSLTPTDRYAHPLYQRPPDLVTDPITGKVIGTPYPSRSKLENSGKLKGLELVYLPSALDAYIVHVNGSAQITLTDGRVIHVGYAGTNGHKYTSIGQLMVKDGRLDASRMSLSAIRSYFHAHPDQLSRYINQNDRFVFFREYDGNGWPAGSLGFQVTPMRTLATDKGIFPRGCAVFVKTTFPTPTGGRSTLSQLMMDQDTGGAIRAAGRADIYVGIGSQAEQIAGRQAAKGRLYYLLLKEHRLPFWLNKMADGELARK